MTNTWPEITQYMARDGKIQLSCRSKVYANKSVNCDKSEFATKQRKLGAGVATYQLCVVGNTTVLKPEIMRDFTEVGITESYL